MSETKWTKGTWVYEPIPGYQFVVFVDRFDMKLVASGVPLGRESEAQANLQLAAAAPELYEALEAMLKGHDHVMSDCRYIKARAALAKARGESPDAK